MWAGVLKLVHDLIMFLPSFILERLLHHMALGGSKGAFGVGSEAGRVLEMSEAG